MARLNHRPPYYFHTIHFSFSKYSVSLAIRHTCRRGDHPKDDRPFTCKLLNSPQCLFGFFIIIILQSLLKLLDSNQSPLDRTLVCFIRYFWALSSVVTNRRSSFVIFPFSLMYSQIDLIASLESLDTESSAFSL